MSLFVAKKNTRAYCMKNVQTYLYRHLGDLPWIYLRYIHHTSLSSKSKVMYLPLAPVFRSNTSNITKVTLCEGHHYLASFAPSSSSILPTPYSCHKRISYALHMTTRDNIGHFGILVTLAVYIFRIKYTHYPYFFV